MFYNKSSPSSQKKRGTRSPSTPTTSKSTHLLRPFSLTSKHFVDRTASYSQFTHGHAKGMSMTIKNRKTVGETSLNKRSSKEDYRYWSKKTWDKDRLNRALSQTAAISKSNKQGGFTDIITQCEHKFGMFYNDKNYEEAALQLIKILNYCIDYSQTTMFQQSLKQLAYFYLIINKANFSLFYYNQLRVCSLMLLNPDLLVDSLIGCSQCCKKVEMFEEALVFLKKGLQCAWFYRQPQLQLKIYDEIGKVYYLIGDIQKALQFHEKFSVSGCVPDNFPQANLSRQRMMKLCSPSYIPTYTQICESFLTHFKIPILNSKQLSLGQGASLKIRQHFEMNNKYYHELLGIKGCLRKIMAEQFFQIQIQEIDQGASKRKGRRTRKGNKTIDLNLRRYLKDQGYENPQKIELKPRSLAYKQNLDEKISRKLCEEILDSRWEQKLMREIKRDRENKLFHVHNQIRVRDRNKPVRLEIQQVRSAFTSFCR